MCRECLKNAVYMDLSGKRLCKNHFIKYYEKKVSRVIRRFNLINKNDKIVVAVSGGKDSTALLHFLHKYSKRRMNNITALIIDEGIKGYRNKTLKQLEDYCKSNKISLKIASFKKEWGFDLDAIVKLIKEKKLKINACYACGVLRRYLINKYALELKATKLATAHCLNDEAQTIIINFLKGNPELLLRAGPVSGIKEYKGFVQRIKPLYLCTEKENMLYCMLNNIAIDFNECKYLESYRLYVRNFLNSLEAKYPGSHHAVINTFLAIKPSLKKYNADKKDKLKIAKCKNCGFLSSRDLCKACEIVKQIKIAKQIKNK